ncbi:MAG: metallophosphoesterase [Propionibacteriaceae bacterium]|nr:metallophosphoesterase [Propionibacteriaceae bacterium]
MNLFSFIRDGVAVCLVGAGLFFFLHVVLRVRRATAVGSTIVLAVATLCSFLAPDLVYALGSTSDRGFFLLASSGIAVVFYLGWGLAAITVVNVIWWWVSRRRADRRPVARRMVDEAGEQPVTSVPVTAQDAPSQPVASQDVRTQDVRTQDPRTRRTVMRVMTAVVVAASVVVTGHGFIQAQRPVVTPMTLTFSTLPSNFDGLTIALLTDLHISAMTRASFLPMLVDDVNAAHPDLIVIAGDVVDGHVSDLAPRLAPLKKLSAPYGVVVTTGNHEFYSDAAGWMTAFSSLGLTVLDNDGIQLVRGDQSIQVLGVNDRAGRGALAPDLQKAWDQVDAPPGTFSILAAHEPVQVFDEDHLASRLGIDLQLSGHTHGGQLWPLQMLVPLRQPAAQGVHVIDHVTVVTSRGIGAWRPPVRVGADPQIPLITLRHQPG